LSEVAVKGAMPKPTSVKKKTPNEKDVGEKKKIAVAGSAKRD